MSTDKSRNRSIVIDPFYNKTADTVVQYLQTLYQDNTESVGKCENSKESGVKFDAFGTEHASFLLQEK